MPGAVELLHQGQVLQSQGRFREAEEQFQLAVNVSAALQRPNTEAAALSNLANVEIDLGHPDMAARLYNRAIAVLRSVTEDSTVAVEEMSLRLVELYLESGQTATAGRLVDHVIAAQEARQSGPSRANAFACDLRAGVYAYSRKPRDAERMERKAIAVFEAANSQNDPEYAVAVLHLAVFLKAGKRPAEALPYAQRAVALLGSLAVRPISIEANAMITLASIHAQLKQAAEARANVEEARAMVEGYFGADHPRTGRTLLAAASVLRAIGDNKAARGIQARAERIMAENGNAAAMATVTVEGLLHE